MKIPCWLLSITFALLVSSCGYRFEADQQAPTTTHTITIPYVKGDADGKLTSALIQHLSSSGYFICVQNGGELLLDVVITADHADRIGYRYDRHGPTGERRRRLVAVENRRTITAMVSVVDSRTQTIVLEPTKVVASAEYDYINPDNIRDLVVNTKKGPERSITFSLGQLDSIEGAQDDVSTPIYRRLAQKIVDGLMHLNI